MLLHSPAPPKDVSSEPNGNQLESGKNEKKKQQMKEWELAITELYVSETQTAHAFTRANALHNEDTNSITADCIKV